MPWCPALTPLWITQILTSVLNLGHRIYNTLVPVDPSIEDVDNALGRARNIRLVRHQDDRISTFMETGEQLHQFSAGLRVEVAGGFVGQED